jgi:leader peptidase (prepilin peptidase) / N-methyltransferase
VTDLHPVTAVVTGVLGLASGPLVPWLIGRVPEPDPEPEPEESGSGSDSEAVSEAVSEADGQPEEPKEPYAVIAGLPGLAVEAGVAGGVAAALLGLTLGWSWALLVVLPLVPVSVALAVIDWRTRLLPRKLILPALAGSLVTIAASWALGGFDGGMGTVVRTLVACAAAFLGFFVLWFIYPRGMGFGDVRLSALLGLVLGYLGWSEWVVGLYGGFLLGAVIGGVLSLIKVVDRKGYPFGPFMLVGALVGVLAGQPLIDKLYS